MTALSYGLEHATGPVPATVEYLLPYDDSVLEISGLESVLEDLPDGTEISFHLRASNSDTSCPSGSLDSSTVLTITVVCGDPSSYEL